MIGLLAVGMLCAVAGQQVGTLTKEYHPPMPIQRCRKDGGCSSEATSLVMDVQWRWLHNKAAYNQCLDGQWNKDLCPDPETCSQKCAVEGVDEKGYTQTYKAAAAEGALTLTFPNGPRMYMLEGDDAYKVFKLKNREFTFDTDVSTLPCGMNAALYFIEMSADGGKSDLNPAGAEYGTGYCDAQCPHMRFVDGKANMLDWQKHGAKNPDGKVIQLGPEGRYGICCAELDLFEANREAAQLAAHPCKFPEQKVCEGDKECGSKEKGFTGFCDKDGCGFNSFRMGDKAFWGPGSSFTIDTSKPVTVVTQFITSDNTDDGDLAEIRRLYIQGGKVMVNSKASALPHASSSLTDKVCDVENKVFNETTYSYKELGGLKAMGEAMARGMVLSLSVWDDDFGRMLWLDAKQGKVDEDPKKKGVARGKCAFGYGSDADEKAYAKAHDGKMEVTFKNIKYGEIGSTWSDEAADPSGKFLAEPAGWQKTGRQPVARKLAPLAAALLAAGGLAAGAMRLMRTPRAAGSFKATPLWLGSQGSPE